MTERHALICRGLVQCLVASLILEGCSRPSPQADKTPAGAAADPAPATTPATRDSSPRFVNTLWKVSRSSGVEPGQLYVFFADGTLLITSSHSTPALGRWEHRADTLTLIEEGLRHPATVVRLVADTFAITVRGGGKPLDITFVREKAP
ncbi:MAG: hypothetical protein H0T50_07930 [Gemmatimonadales bacterium]|nr:hypothetical protein [Gemmatimonadales bacterium]